MSQKSCAINGAAATCQADLCDIYTATITLPAHHDRRARTSEL